MIKASDLSWTVCGLLLSCLSILTVFSSLPLEASYPLILATLLGSLFTTLWKWRGLISAGLLFILVSLYLLDNDPSVFTLKYLLANSAMNAAVVVCALCSKEFEERFHSVLQATKQLASSEEQPPVSAFDPTELIAEKEQLQQTNERLLIETDRLSIELDLLQQQLKEKEAQQPEPQPHLPIADIPLFNTNTQTDLNDPVTPLPIETEHLILQNNSLSEELAVLDRNYRTLNGKYMQLKQQFNEKTTLLDDTRAKLFHANEELELAKRIQEETTETQKDAFAKVFEKFLPNLEKEKQKAVEAYEIEIDQLHDLIDALMKK